MSARIYAPDDVDSHLIADYLDCLRDEQEAIERDLQILGKDYGNQGAVNALFRSIHSVKGNARMCLLNPLSDYIHHIEEAISEIRAGRLQFFGLLGEAILVALDQLMIKTEELGRQGSTDIQIFDAIGALFQQIQSATPGEAKRLATQVIQIAGGDIVPQLQEQAPTIEPKADKTPQVSLDHNETLGFFRELATNIDAKSPCWENRSEQQLQIARSVNDLLPTPVDRTQLSAAVLLHDLGMAFLPEALINKTQKFNLLEEKRVRQHVRWGFEWLNRMNDFSEAAIMVQQHHERPDGTGYPNGLMADQIHDGAQIIAIADAFFAITNQRSDRTYKKSLMRAITEINSYKDSQFNDHIVTAFNQLMRAMYARSS